MKHGLDDLGRAVPYSLKAYHSYFTTLSRGPMSGFIVQLGSAWSQGR